MKWSLERLVPAAILLGIAIARLLAGGAPTGEPAPEAPPPVAPPPVARREEPRPQLDGVTEGDEIGGLRVARMSTAAGGEIVLELEGGHRGMRVWVAPRGSRGGAAPARTERFDLYRGPPPPGLEPVPDAEAQAIVAALVERLGD
jgi:hypothetical protein